MTSDEQSNPSPQGTLTIHGHNLSQAVGVNTGTMIQQTISVQHQPAAAPDPEPLAAAQELLGSLLHASRTTHHGSQL